VVDDHDRNSSVTPNGLHYVHAFAAVAVVAVIMTLAAISSEVVQQRSIRATWLAPLARHETYAFIVWPVVLWAVIRLSRSTWRGACPIRGFPPKIILSLAPVVWSLTILNAQMMFLLFRDAQRASETWTPPDTFFLLNTIVVVPIAEELFFRGWMLRGLTAEYGTRRAVLVTSCLFALMHASNAGWCSWAGPAERLAGRVHGFIGPRDHQPRPCQQRGFRLALAVVAFLSG
jgi:membrane protease YdiL (CAAX protease family)